MNYSSVEAFVTIDSAFDWKTYTEFITHKVG